MIAMMMGSIFYVRRSKVNKLRARQDDLRTYITGLTDVFSRTPNLESTMTGGSEAITLTQLTSSTFWKGDNGNRLLTHLSNGSYWKEEEGVKTMTQLTKPLEEKMPLE